MLDTVYEYGLREKERIAELVESCRKSRPEAARLWRSGEIPEWEGKTRIAAVDGSYNRMDFREFILYAVDAECVIYDGGGISTRAEAVVDLLRPYRYARNRLQLYMAMLELRLANLVLEEGQADLVLFDGSLYGQAIRPLPFDREMPDALRSRVIEGYLPALEEGLWKREKPIASTALFMEMHREFGDDFAEAAGYLEYLEHLLVLGQLLE
ncbi:DNA double-strand break repair nuclease NurA, partial [Methanothrix sp.]|uniref:DNA double-strand break repair nuclease NurA n=1 Tax=Methanothrix sp. TaxID=90426 RepID=UPI0034E2A51C